MGVGEEIKFWEMFNWMGTGDGFKTGLWMDGLVVFLALLWLGVE